MQPLTTPWHPRLGRACLAAALFLALPLLASARTETLEWTHSQAWRVTGFRLHVGVASGQQTQTIDLGLPGSVAGVFSKDFEVPAAMADGTIYVTLTAYNAEEESVPSNEKALAAPPPPDPTDPPPPTDPTDPTDPTTPTDPGTPPSGDVFYQDDFSTGDGWLDTAAFNSMSVDDSLFQVNGGQLTTSNSGVNIHSHQVNAGGESWSNYELRGRMLLSSTTAGMGVTAYSQYPNQDVYYRLRRYEGNPSFHLAMHPEVSCSDSDTGVSPTANTWYRFALRVETEADLNRIFAKVWVDGDPEPADWQAGCTDSSTNRPSSGTVGVWSMGSGTRSWDDLVVYDLAAPAAPDPDPVSDPDPTVGKPGRPVLLTE